MSIASQLRVINDSVRLIDTTRNYKTRVGRCETILSALRELAVYEQKKIPLGLSTTTEQLRASITVSLSEALTEGLRAALEDALAKSSIATTPAGKTGPLSKVVVDVQAARRAYPEASEEELDDIETEAREALAQAQGDVLRESAERAAFKGQNKKALELYRELLYVLTHDAIDDDEQDDDIERAKARIAELEAVAR